MSAACAVPPEHLLETDVERLAAIWVAPYDQVTHLMRARDWVIELDPSAGTEVRLAAMTHDIERMFSGGPKPGFSAGSWEDPFYLYAHSLRSAEIVGAWLQTTPTSTPNVDVAEVRRLVGLHEVGGLRGADVLQAADSLSFLETLGGLAREWVRSGVCTRAVAEEKLRYSVDRIRVPAALEPARALFERALDLLPATPHDLEEEAS